MTAPSAPLRILVVDDEPAIRRFLKTSLSTQGYQVREAENGKQALDLMRRDAPDVLVLDLGLPDMDGLEVIKDVRAAGSSAPIVVLSSRVDEAGKVRALDLGADDYVTKPFGVEELLARLRTALRHRLQQQGERPVFKSGDLSVDLVRRIVTVKGAEVKLSPREYDLLRLLVVLADRFCGSCRVHLNAEVEGGLVGSRVHGAVAGHGDRRRSGVRRAAFARLRDPGDRRCDEQHAGEEEDVPESVHALDTAPRKATSHPLLCKPE